jgi:hypothetical protein
MLRSIGFSSELIQALEYGIRFEACSGSMVFSAGAAAVLWRTCSFPDLRSRSMTRCGLMSATVHPPMDRFNSHHCDCPVTASLIEA